MCNPRQAAGRSLAEGLRKRHFGEAANYLNYNYAPYKTEKTRLRTTSESEITITLQPLEIKPGHCS
jgi:hypothetical protein